jgi:uncharacterized protein YrrD
MSENLRDAIGRSILSRESAEEIGAVKHLVVDPSTHRATAIVAGSGSAIGLVSWDDVTGFGPDAVMIQSRGAVRDATSDEERAYLAGDRDPLGKLALTDDGNACGTVRDVEFDGASGTIETLASDDERIDGARIVGVGSYAVVIRS